ncbi:MAG: hypothetical protein U0269_16680 [Polyangiales bacterium]
MNHRARITLAALALSLSACQWRLTPPSFRDATLDDRAQDAALVTDANDASDATVDVADAPNEPRIQRCSTAGPTPPTDPDPASRLVHAATLERPTRSNGSGRGVCLGDLDGDGVQELVALRPDATADVLDPATLCVRTTLDVPENARACVIDDLDRDGRPELALALNVRWGAHLDPAVVVGHVEPVDRDGRQWRVRFPSSWRLDETRNIRGIGTPITTIDLDGDGDRELVIGGTVTTDAPRSDAFVRAWEFAESPSCTGESRCPRGVYNEQLDALDTQTLIPAQLDADAPQELLVELGCNRGGLHRFDARWTTPVEIGAIGQTSNGVLVDVDADGTLDFLTSTSPRCNGGYGPNSSLRWLRMSNNELRYYTEVPNPAVPRAAQTALAAMDALYDQRPELLLCSRDADNVAPFRVRCDLFSVDRPFIDREWTWSEPTAHIDMLSSIVVTDANRDGLSDAIIVTEARLHLLLQRNR